VKVGRVHRWWLALIRDCQHCMYPIIFWAHWGNHSAQFKLMFVKNPVSCSENLSSSNCECSRWLNWFTAVSCWKHFFLRISGNLAHWSMSARSIWFNWEQELQRPCSSLSPSLLDGWSCQFLSAFSAGDSRCENATLFSETLTSFLAIYPYKNAIVESESNLWARKQRDQFQRSWQNKQKMAINTD